MCCNLEVVYMVYVKFNFKLISTCHGNVCWFYFVVACWNIL